MTNEGLTVLSLFDGMSCGAIALREAGIKVKQYFASEIDRQAIRQTQHNFPDTVQLGSVKDVKASNLPPIDLLIGGSPCQGFSFAGKQLNFNDPRSALFFEYVRILHEIREYNPGVKFLLENVRMRSEYENVISQYLGVFPIMINSGLLSAQNRLRLYWTNIRQKEILNLFGKEVYTDIPTPIDRNIYLRDILEYEVDKRYYITDEIIERMVRQRAYGAFSFIPESQNGFICFDDDMETGYSGCPYSKMPVESMDIERNICELPIHPPPNIPKVPRCAIQRNQVIPDKMSDNNRTLVIPGAIVSPQFGGGFRPIMNGKAPCLLATSSNHPACLIINGDDMVIRRLTPAECSRLQTIPDWYEWICSESQIYRMLGNGWTVEVIRHILQFLNFK